VRTDQAEMTKGKNMVVSDKLHNWMITPHNPKVGMSKENVLRKPAKRIKPMSAMLIEKYQQHLEEDRMYWVIRGIKQDILFEAWNRLDERGPCHTGEPQRRTVHHSTDRELGIRQNP
jgi:hypothetical protein